MTAKRKDSHSTEFGLWLREQPEICSSKGFIATNVDYLWRNYKTGQWMLIEEKRYGSKIKTWQNDLFKLLSWCCRHHTKFKGFHIITFERTSPEDGWIQIDGIEKTKSQLIDFLAFK